MIEKVIDGLELAEMELDAENDMPREMVKYMPGLMHESMSNFRESLDAAIRTLVGRMMAMHAWEGSVSAKLKVNLEPRSMGETAIGMKHKVSVNVPMKLELEGHCAYPYTIQTDGNGDALIVPVDVQMSFLEGVEG